MHLVTLTVAVRPNGACTAEAVEYELREYAARVDIDHCEVVGTSVTRATLAVTTEEDAAALAAAWPQLPA